MRRSAVIRASAAVVLGAGLAVVCVLAGYWWEQDDRPVTFDETFTESVGADGAYNSTLSVTFGTNWSALLVPAAVGGAVIGLIMGLVVPRRGRRPASIPACVAALGAISGLVGVSASYGWFRYRTSGNGFDRRYVDYLPLAPNSFDWAGFLLPAAATGAALGLVLGAVAYAIVRRSARRAARSA